MCPERDAWCCVYVNHASNMNTWCHWTCSCFLGSYAIVLVFYFFSFSFAFYAITEGFSNSNFCGPKREDFQIIEGSITKQCLDSNIDGPCNLIMTSHNDVDLHTDVPCHEQSSYNIYRKVHGKIQSSQVACFTVCKGTTCSNISLMLEMRSTRIIW